MVALGLRLVIAQRLVRVLCDDCKQPHELEPHEQEWLALSLGEKVASHRYFQGVGCPHCRDAGYRGRTGVYEVIEMTPELVHAANTGDANEFTRVANVQFADFTLRSHAVQLVLSGRTSITEAMRVSNQA